MIRVEKGVSLSLSDLWSISNREAKGSDHRKTVVMFLIVFRGDLDRSSSVYLSNIYSAPSLCLALRLRQNVDVWNAIQRKARHVHLLNNKQGSKVGIILGGM